MSDDATEAIRARDGDLPRDLATAGYGEVYEDRRTLLAALDEARAEYAALAGSMGRARRGFRAEVGPWESFVGVAVQRVRDETRRAALEEAAEVVQSTVRGRVRAEDHDAYVRAIRELLPAEPAEADES